MKEIETADPVIKRWMAEQAHYQILASDVIERALAQGASQAEVTISSNVGFNVSVRMGNTDRVEHQSGKELLLTVYHGKQQGSASTSDFSLAALQMTLDAANRIARLSQPDPGMGLADAHLMAYHYPDLDLYYPWSITLEDAIELARVCEANARSKDPRIINSEGGHVSTHSGFYLYANSHGFSGNYLSSQHSLGCFLIARDQGGMQQDGSYTVSRVPSELQTVDHVATEASARVLKRLGSKRLKTCQVPVIFHAEIAYTLIGWFLSAISGSSLYRKRSFLLDQINHLVFSDHVHIFERPHLPKALNSAPFDTEGVAIRDYELVVGGVLKTYLLSSYSARKLGLETTGHAGGIRNVFVESTESGGLTSLLNRLGTGLLITELIGNEGVNPVTGDYSQGAFGFWIEEGHVQYPVTEITVAGNLRDMYRHIIAIGDDRDLRHSVITGSILMENMMVAGE